MKKIATLCVFISLTSCASKQPVVDNSMKNPTAVLTAKGAVSGFVIPDASFTEFAYTREDRRMLSTKREYDSWMARQFFGNSADTVIYRMDRNLRWTMIDNDGEKTYTECPLVGCVNVGMEKYDPKNNANKEGGQPFDYDPNDKSASTCPIHVTKNSFKVTDTGKSRLIAGHTSNEYHANWVVEYQDDKGRKDSNRLLMVLWNAQPNEEMKKVWAMTEKADEAYLKKIEKDKNVLSAVMPEEILAVLSTFTGNLSNSEWAKNVAKEMAKVKGYPMATKVEWYLDRKACVEPQEAKKEQGIDWANPVDAMTNMASKMATDKATEMFLPDPNEPILAYDYEITGAAIKDEHDSIFDVPQDYKRVTKR